MSKVCRYILSKCCRLRTISIEAELDHIIIFSYCEYFPIIERSKCTIKQSEDWLMPTVNPNIYLRDGITLVNLLHLLCPLFSFVLLLANNLLRFSDNSSPSIEHNKQLMAPKEIVTMTMSSFVTYLMIDASLMNSLCLLCPLYSFVLLLSLLRILVKISVQMMLVCQNNA